jgi:hypothetical protein
MCEKVLIFLETRVRSKIQCNDIETLQYLICEVDLDTYDLIFNAIIKNEKFSSFEYHYTLITPLRIKIIKKEELKTYHDMFNFTGQNFATIPRLVDILKEIKYDILKNKIKYLIQDIFNFYKTIDKDFMYNIQDEYEKVIVNKDTKELSKYKIFLEDWKDYINYVKARKDIIYPNLWDKNLNGIIEQYLNVNPYYCQKFDCVTIFYYFFESQNWLNLPKYTLEELEKMNLTVSRKYDKIIKYMKKTNYQTTYVYM